MIFLPKNKIARAIVRIVFIALLAYSVGWVMNKSAGLANDGAEAAGFGSGVIHGALMPAAMPSLLAGRDIIIYAPRNNGRWYKLGYTVGVNACGAIFFGIFYWRLNRWRKLYAA